MASQVGTKKFFDLPLEVRRIIYEEVLPRQKIRPQNPGWASWDHNQRPVALCYTNQQIHDEILDNFSMTNCPTISFNPFTRLTIDAPIFLKDWPAWDLAKTIPLIKRWQLSIYNVPVTSGQRMKSFEVASNDDEEKRWDDVRELITFYVNALPKDLKTKPITIKIKVPCLCQLGLQKPEQGFAFLSQYLQPLKRISVSNCCTFLTSRQGLDTQCSELKCEVLATTFIGLREVIEGKVILQESLSLRTIQERWINMKQRAMHLPYDQMEILLKNSWTYDGEQKLVHDKQVGYSTKYPEKSLNGDLEAHAWSSDYQRLVRDGGEPPDWLKLEVWFRRRIASEKHRQREERIRWRLIEC
ncbi:MAG: hypothetical protein Q9170_005486 [Blastenia crenularia]